MVTVSPASVWVAGGLSDSAAFAGSPTVQLASSMSTDIMPAIIFLFFSYPVLLSYFYKFGHKKSTRFWRMLHCFVTVLFCCSAGCTLISIWYLLVICLFIYYPFFLVDCFVVDGVNLDTYRSIAGACCCNYSRYITYIIL